MQPDFDSLARAVGQRQAMLDRTNLRPVDAVDSLHHPDHDVSDLGQCKLLADADSWPAVKGKIIPAGPARQPSLRFEDFGVGAPDILAAMHQMNLDSC